MSTNQSRISRRVAAIAESATLAVDAKAKAYLAKDSDVNWGPLKGNDTSISDYDRLTLTLIKKNLIPSSEITFQWVLGDKLFKTDSFNLDFHKECEIAGGKVPLYVRYHQGPMHTLADYTKSNRSLGFGLKFSDFAAGK